MATRYLIAAAFLVGSACGAQAAVVSASTTDQSGFLSNWTTGNGTNVATSGVLGSGTTLVGGAAVGNAGLAQALYNKASANVAATDGKVNLSLAEGVNGTYVVKTGNQKLAALYGNGVKVMTTAQGTIVVKDQTSNDVPATSTPAAGAPVASTPVSSTPVSSTPVVSTPVSSTPVNTIPVAQEGSNGNTSPVVDNGTPTQLPQQINGGTGGVGAGLPNAGPAAINGEVPEPSSIALLMAGMMGALALTRRRAK